MKKYNAIMWGLLSAASGYLALQTARAAVNDPMLWVITFLLGTLFVSSTIEIFNDNDKKE